MNAPSGKNRPTRPRDARPSWVSATEAAALLGVKRSTLYAYVSRGKIRTQSLPDERGRHYARADLEAIKAGSDARRGHGPTAALALRWGEPVLASSITRIDSDGPWYREHSAVELARADVAFERVAELLWTGELPGESTWDSAPLPLPLSQLAGLVAPAAHPAEALAIALPLLGTRDDARFATSAEGALTTTRRLCRWLTAILALPKRTGDAALSLSAPSLAEAVRIALGGRPRARAAINAALVLCADHELNASTFAARVAASAGAPPHACLSAAIATFSGPAHGAASLRVEALVREAGAPERAARTVRDRLARGAGLPGFGHPLYPDGDPRAAELLRLANEIARPPPAARTLRALVDSAALAGAPAPNLDVALVSLTTSLGLPPQSAMAVFAIGRMAGWTAHALEQRAERTLLRPRARYVPAESRTPPDPAPQ